MASQLRTRIRIEERAPGQDELGQPVETWTTVAELWADVRHTSGMEAARAGAQISEARASVRIRWRTDITPAMRVVETFTGLVYDIKAVLPDLQRRQHVDLVCEAGR